MESNGTKEFRQEEDTESLIINNNISTGDGGYYGTGVATVKVVEYMLSSMSNELLHKFPDNSAFDFDYTQSSIWSPLVPHPSRPPSPAPEMRRKLTYDEEFTSNVKDAVFNYSCMFNCFNFHHNFSNKKRRSGYRGFDQFGSNSVNFMGDPVSSSPIEIKGWKKVLKAASKRFKKTMKKKESGAHLKLSSNGFSQISYY